MNTKQYCEKLLQSRDKEISLKLFLGRKWIFLKIILIGLGVFLIIYPGLETKVFGGITLGYALGKIGLYGVSSG